jgi:hypothetical protein
MKESYRNILELIEINENIKFECESNLRVFEKFFLKAGPKGYSGGTSYQDFDCIHGSKAEIGLMELESISTSIDKLKELILIQEIILDNLYDSKANIDKKLSKLTGLGYEVAYLKYVEGFSLQKIADQLHISYGYTKNLSAET